MPHAEMEFDACHTMGMLLQEYGEKDVDVSFIAYRVVHPLERRVSLKVATLEGKVSDALKRVIQSILDDLQKLRTEHSLLDRCKECVM